MNLSNYLKANPIKAQEHLKKIIFLGAIVTYCLTAYFSVGYYHPDEHFQILEFANFKLGNIQSNEMPWEFAQKIRASFQPWICFLFLKTFKSIGVVDPYWAAFLLRVFSGLLAVFIINRFVDKNLYQVDKNLKIFFIIISYFLWFLPFINVRFSSETWSGLLFLLAVSYLSQDTATSFKSIFLIGCLCGFSFLLRFQIGLMFFGLLSWMGFIKKERLLKIAAILLVFLVVIFLGAVLDKLYYGAWELTFWNYFKANIINNVASLFGVIPWYSFLFEVSFAMMLPIGILIFLALFVLLIDTPKSLFVFIAIPLLIAHLIIPHKEVRFLFPLANFAPIILIKGYQQFVILCSIPNGADKKSRSYIPSIFLFANLCALVPAVFIAPLDGRISMCKYISRKFENTPVVLYSLNVQEANPFVPYSFLRQSFYESPNIKVRLITNYASLTKEVFNSDSTRLLVIRQGEIVNPVLQSRINDLNLKFVSFSIPKWIQSYISVYNPMAKHKVYILYTN